MQHVTSRVFALSATALLLLACEGARPLDPSLSPDDQAREARRPAANGAVTLVLLPSLGGNSEAKAVDGAGTVIVGHSFDRGGLLYAVKWTLRSGSWAITKLPYTISARGLGVDDQGNAVGYQASGPQDALRWPAAGGWAALDCAQDVGVSRAVASSADGQLVVGAGASRASFWRPGGCREDLPSLVEGGSASASTVSGDGNIAGGSASLDPAGQPVPVRWRQVEGAWNIEQLDARAGRALGANHAGDLAGVANVPCPQGSCNNAVIWYANGAVLDLGALGAEWAEADDVNSAGDVVGVSTTNGRSTAFIWSPGLGARQLASKRGDGVARALSEVRGDGTRLVVGMTGTTAAVWVVRNP